MHHAPRLPGFPGFTRSVLLATTLGGKCVCCTQVTTCALREGGRERLAVAKGAEKVGGEAWLLSVPAGGYLVSRLI